MIGDNRRVATNVNNGPDDFIGITIDSGTGESLVGGVLEPEGAAIAAVVVHPATGVTQGLYRRFARHLADAGFAVLIYDYSGCGDSAAKGDDRRTDLRMSDWMLHDIPAANARARELWPDLPLLAVGHSVGSHGQIAVQSESPVEALAMIASHAGITALIPNLREKARVWAFFNLVVPVTSRLFGRVPVAEIGMGKPIPLGALTQWARWSRDRGYFFADEEFDFERRYGQARFPVLSVCFADDDWATRRATGELTRRMPAAEITEVDMAPSSGEAIGHMGFFRSPNAARWPEVTAWLRERAGSRRV